MEGKTEQAFLPNAPQRTKPTWVFRQAYSLYVPACLSRCLGRFSKEATSISFCPGIVCSRFSFLDARNIVTKIKRSIDLIANELDLDPSMKIKINNIFL